MSPLLQRMKQAREKAEAKAKESQKSNFYDLQDGKTIIRLLPSREMMEYLDKLDRIERQEIEDDTNGIAEFFYKTVTYHYIPTGRDANGKEVGKYVFSKRYYEVESKEKGIVNEQNPLDYIANLCYKSDSKEFKSLYSVIKRKRFFIMNALVYDANGKNPQLVVLRDKSNDGALVKQLCKILGEKFQLDTNLPVKEQNKKEGEEADAEVEDFEESVQVKDILSTDMGFRVAIVKKSKEKMIPNPRGEGEIKIKIPDYSETKTSKDATPLSAEEQEMFVNRAPLSDFIKVCDFEEVEKTLEEFIEFKQLDLNKLYESASGESKTSTKSGSKQTTSPPKSKPEVTETVATQKEKPVHTDLAESDKSLLEEFE